jgi:exonuclease SbcD
MRFFHLSDLHLGIRVNEFSMLDDQWHIIREIVRHAEEHKPDAVLIAGDVYDKSVPPIDAVQLLDRLLVWLNELGIAVFLISGNHDSAERVSFAASLLEMSNVHISQVYDGKITPLTMQDTFGDINVWMLPYIKPSTVRPYFREKEIITYTDAVSAALGNAEVDAASRNILLTHQFITGAIQSDSEELYIGGSENVNASLFDVFDYVALGHMHRPQNVLRKNLRYSGTPLKYSLSEVNQNKSITMVDMGKKGDISVSEINLTPIREMREIRGTYAKITALKNYVNTHTDDDGYIVLTDENEEPDAISKIRTIYPNIMNLRYDNKRTQTDVSHITARNYDSKTPLDLLAELYALQNGQPMSQNQMDYSKGLLEKIKEENA